MRKLLVLLFVAFVIYFLVSDPDSMASGLRDIGGLVVDFFDSVIRFFRELI